METYPYGLECLSLFYIIGDPKCFIFQVLGKDFKELEIPINCSVWWKLAKLSFQSPSSQLHSFNSSSGAIHFVSDIVSCHHCLSPLSHMLVATPLLLKARAMYAAKHTHVLCVKLEGGREGGGGLKPGDVTTTFSPVCREWFCMSAAHSLVSSDLGAVYACEE